MKLILEVVMISKIVFNYNLLTIPIVIREAFSAGGIVFAP